MSKIIPIITAIITLIGFIISLAVAIAGFVEAYWGLTAICIMLATTFGYFVKLDYDKFVKKE